MYRLVSANGTTSTANEDIMPAMRTFTTIAGKDPAFDPFNPRSLYLVCETQTTIKVNGEGATFLEVNPATNEYFINLDKWDVNISTLQIVDTGIVWRCTFLY